MCNLTCAWMPDGNRMVVVLAAVAFFGTSGCNKPESTVEKPIPHSDTSIGDAEHSAFWSSAYVELHHRLDNARSVDDFDTAHTTCARLRSRIDGENRSGRSRRLVEWNDQCQTKVRIRLVEWVLTHSSHPDAARWCAIATERLQFLKDTRRKIEVVQGLSDRLDAVCRGQTGRLSAVSEPSRKEIRPENDRVR